MLLAGGMLDIHSSGEKASMIRSKS